MCWRADLFRRMRRTILIAIMACCVLAPATADAHTAAKRSTASQPTSVALLGSMLTAADEWWTEQGSPPPCPMAAQVTWGVEGLYSEWAYYDSCVMMLSPHWWATQYAFLTGPRKRSARIRAAAYDLALLMHARGHNIGYHHIAGTVMQENTPVVPGWCFEWAARSIR